MRPALLLPFTLILGLAACSKPEKQATSQVSPPQETTPSPGANYPAESHPDLGKTGLDDLRAAAEEGSAGAQRELAVRILFGQGVAADPTGALVWVERAAKGGDPSAALWMGRKFLNEPPDRIAAASWFLTAAEAGNTAVRQDTVGELEALALSAQERDQATLLSIKLKAEIRSNSK